MTGLFKRKISIKLIWVLLGIISFIFISFFVLFCFILNWNIKDSIDYTSKITIATVAFITLVYHLNNLDNQINTQIESNKQNLSKYTYDICSAFYNPNMMDVIEDFRCLLRDKKELLNDPNKINEFVEFIENSENKKHRQSLVLLLNYFESISAMVLVGDLDNDIVKRLFGKIFGYNYSILKNYIDFRQKEHKKTWSNYEKLSKKWDDDDKS